MKIFDKKALDSLITDFVSKFEDEEAQALRKLKKKTLDPLIFSLDYKKRGDDFRWEDAATYQAIRKARENRIGDLHEQLFELLPDWKRLPHGSSQPDLVCESKKILVELKSREDTPKASDKPIIYDSLEANLALEKYKGYTAVFGHILNMTKKSMPAPEPFTPSDAKTKSRRPANSRILRMDGRLLWSLATSKSNNPAPPFENPGAILQVYSEVLDSIFRVNGGTADPDLMATLLGLQKSNFKLK
jgi:hypothetical protein